MRPPAPEGPDGNPVCHDSRTAPKPHEPQADLAQAEVQPRPPAAAVPPGLGKNRVATNAMSHSPVTATHARARSSDPAAMRVRTIARRFQGSSCGYRVDCGTRVLADKVG